MSLGRHNSGADEVRDVTADYIAAYLADYEKFAAYGREDMTDAIARDLRALGHEIEPKKPAKAPAKEKAVDPEPLEKAVEGDAPPAKRGRPAKTAE